MLREPDPRLSRAKGVAVGQRFGRLLVVGRAPIDENLKNRGARWLCVCDCGAEAIVRADRLRASSSRSCGCLSRDTAIAVHTRHGMCASREYCAWVNMRRRCSDPTTRHWKNYGGRGIRVCTQWEGSFEAFIDCVGSSPGRGYELDRIDNDKGYEPGNVRWATKAENNANRRITKRVQA